METLCFGEESAPSQPMSCGAKVKRGALNLPAPQRHKGGFWVNCWVQRMQEEGGHCLASWVARELALHRLPRNSHSSLWPPGEGAQDTGGQRLRRAGSRARPETLRACGLSPSAPLRSDPAGWGQGQASALWGPSFPRQGGERGSKERACLEAAAASPLGGGW